MVMIKGELFKDTDVEVCHLNCVISSIEITRYIDVSDRTHAF